jgi:hypothetical protein
VHHGSVIVVLQVRASQPKPSRKSR